MLSLSIDFYARVFVRVYTSPIEVKHMAKYVHMHVRHGASQSCARRQTGTVYKCYGCDTFHLQPFGHEEARGK